MKRKRDRDGIYTRADRRGYWISYVNSKGQRKQKKLAASTLQQARLLRSAELQAAERARVLNIKEPAKDTFADVMPRYLKHQQARLTAAAYARTKGILEAHLKPVFGQMQLALICRGDAQQYITGRSVEVSPGTVVREVNVLKHVLTMAVEWELITGNPCARLKAPRVPAGRVRYLQPAELRAVLEACPEWLRPIVALLVCTGMRRSEALSLRWLDVDFAGKRIVLPQTKNGESRVVNLNSLARQALQFVLSQDAKPTDKVFPPNEHVTPENVSLAFLRSCRKCGIADFRLHDLRHTAASWMRMQGADIHTVAALLGHRDLRMAARYQHLSPTYLQTAVEGLDKAFAPELATLPMLQAPAQA